MEVTTVSHAGIANRIKNILSAMSQYDKVNTLYETINYIFPSLELQQDPVKTYDENWRLHIQDDENNVTRFLLMGKDIYQPEFNKGDFLTSFLFKLKSKPAALYSALSGFALNGLNLTKLQSFPEKNSFSSFFFLCDIEGHIEEDKIKNSLKELGLHCEDMHVLGVYKADKIRKK